MVLSMLLSVIVFLRCGQFLCYFLPIVLLFSPDIAFWFFFIGIIILFGLIKLFRIPPLGKVISDDVFGSDKMTIAHRGCGQDAPENTIEAFKLAKANGADAVEFDVEFTKDGVPVLLHDDTVDRTTNGIGHIRKMTYSQARELDARGIHKDKFVSAQIPSLEDGLRECLDLNLRIFIDVKANDSRAVMKLKELFSKDKRLYQLAIVCSFYPLVIYKMRRVDPRIVTALTWRPAFIYDNYCGDSGGIFKEFLCAVAEQIYDWSHHNILWYICGVSAVLMHNSLISTHYLKQWSNRDIRVFVWTVNDKCEKEFLTKTCKISYMTDSICHSEK